MVASGTVHMNGDEGETQKLLSGGKNLSATRICRRGSVLDMLLTLRAAPCPSCREIRFAVVTGSSQCLGHLNAKNGVVT